jgi:hypothetical protein
VAELLGVEEVLVVVQVVAELDSSAGLVELLEQPDKSLLVFLWQREEFVTGAAVAVVVGTACCTA